MLRRAALTFTVCLPLWASACVLERGALASTCDDGEACVVAADAGAPPEAPLRQPVGDASSAKADAGDAGGGTLGDGASGQGTGGSDKVLAPPADQLPKATTRCPTMVEGTALFAGSAVQLWVGTDGESKRGPLVFYWYGADSDVNEVQEGLGASVIAEIKALGGMVAALVHTTDEGSSVGSVWHSDDLEIADEVLACALATGVGIDTSHIHSVGFGSGGLMTSRMAYARSNYLASVVSYSGGLTSTLLTTSTSADPSNVVDAMMVHGRYGIDTRIIDFSLTSAAMTNDIEAKGGFALDCTHDFGHDIPAGIGDAALRFMLDHGYKRSSPYENGLPAAIPSYCSH